MNAFQIASLVFIVGLPALIWWLDRRPHLAAYVRHSERGLAVALLVVELGFWVAKWWDGTFTLQYALPMQLCDWALFAVAAALWWRWRPGFEVAYFWGLAGTVQAIFTPDISQDIHWIRRLGFFFVHAGIVAGVLHLLITARFRPVWPRSIVRLVVASEIYLACALATNALTDGNYGFLSWKPSVPSMLDLLSDSPWLYVWQLNLLGFGLFALLYLPWLVVDGVSRSRQICLSKR